MTTDELKDLIRKELRTIAGRVESALRQGTTLTGSTSATVKLGHIKGLRAALGAIADGLKSLAEKLE